MKKVLSIAVLTGLSSFAMAQQPSFYVGGQVGFNNTNMEASVTSSVDNLYANIDGLGLSGVAGGVHGGIEFDLGTNFFALETNVGTSDADVNIRGQLAGFAEGNMQLKSALTYGLSALWGMNVVENTRIFGRIGYQWTEFELRERGNGHYFSGDERFGGLRLGLGMETSLTQQLALRLDWNYTMYSSESDGQGADRMSLQPTESLVQAGLNFRF